MAWFNADPECGIYRDEFGGTNFGSEYPCWYFRAPIYFAWALTVLDALRGAVTERMLPYREKAAVTEENQCQN